MCITFDKDIHQYYNDGNPIISVTQLMQEQGVAPNYSAVKSDILKAAADRGTLIHGEIEEYNKTGEIGFTPEVQNFIEYITNNNIKVLKSEFLFGNEDVAGTADLLLEIDGVKYMADIKTTSTIHTGAVAWQLGLYVYLLNDPTVNAEFGFVFHFDIDGYLNVKKINLVSREEIEKLITCHKEKTIYNRGLSTVEQEQLMELAELQNTIKAYKDKVDAFNAECKKITDGLIKSMKDHGVLSLDFPGVIRVTYIAPSTKEIIDSAKLKAEKPEIYKEYTKTSNVKESIRIKTYE